MAYNTKSIIFDVNGKPIPQFYDPVNDVYRQLTGESLGNNRYGTDHIPWGKTAGGVLVPLRVDANGQPQAGIPDGADVARGAKADAAVVDPTLSASEIAILKGLLKQMRGEGTEGKSMPVQVSGSNLPLASNKIVVDTLINAQSYGEGVTSTGTIAFGTTSEKELWILVGIDAQPWTLAVGRAWTPISHNLDTVYPKRASATTTHTGNYLAVSLYLGITPNASYGLTEPSSIAEAKQYATPPPTGLTGYVAFPSAGTKTVTVKVIRVWR